ncbi:MAG: DUF1553 domain-containing protein [Planctomycetota bacterium]|nr:DUF1553 domain-containing protein [Planctomycetota bacterium]
MSLRQVMPRVLIAFTFSVTSLSADSPQERFDNGVGRLLAARCLGCHSGVEPKGRLNLATHAAAMKGGENGVVLKPGRLEDSELWKRVAKDEMPPKQPLSELEKEMLEQWIVSGAKWGTDPIDRLRYTTDRRAGYDWWSLQPIRNVTPPEIGDTPWPRNAIDEFVWQRLTAAKLSPSQPADPRTLIRRVYFDLLGLPPSPEVVAEFVRSPTDAAYAQIVDELLKSPRYGERWGRHWLDIVRFGESDGFERNGPRMNAWPYRDWIIDSLNDDMPYDEFVRMQLIGDLLKPGREGAASVGFLVAGVHNTVVGGSERMKKLAKQDELEEVIGAVGQTFLGLTANCARCHDHKFDPIKQTEYYQLISTISGMNHGERDVRSTIDSKQLASLTGQIGKLSQHIAVIDETARKGVLAARKQGKAKPPEPPRPFAQWDFDGDLKDRIGNLHGKIVGSATLENGALVVDGKSYVETPVIDKAIREKTLEAWIQVDTLDQSGGAAISLETPGGGIFDAIVFAERETQRWMAGSNGFVRTLPFNGPQDQDAAKRPVHVALVYQADGTIIGYRDGQPYGKPIKKSGLQSYVPKQSRLLFGLRHSPPGGNRFLKGRIFKASLYDRALTPDAVAASAGTSSDFVPEKQIVAFLDQETRTKRATLKTQLAGAEQQRKTIEAAANQKMYTMNPGNPGLIRFLHRGDIEKEGDVVSPAAVASVKGVKADFGLTPQASDADRRRKLSAWVTNADNPLLARVIVNRVWQYHFGTGFIRTPSDFGFNGGLPSHPDLIDWLSRDLKTNDFRLKSLHRLIVTSSTYRQSSARNQTALNVDAENRLLWRMSPRRLDAESVRDAILSTAGKLNVAMGGPGFIDVSITPNNGTTYYEDKDVDGDEYFRRTVYRFTPRGGRSSLLDTFDCPDPATAAPRRAITTTPLQALSLLNNAFVLRMADYFAQRLGKVTGDNVGSIVDRAWQLAIARAPNDVERALSIELVAKHGLPALCRGLFNASEFVIVE